jgi:hypothetical protein
LKSIALRAEDRQHRDSYFRLARSDLVLRSAHRERVVDRAHTASTQMQFI